MTYTQFLILGIFIGIPIGLIISLIIAGKPLKHSNKLYERDNN